MEYIFGLDKIPENKISLIGGKAKSLSLMINNLKVNVPYGYVLTADATAKGILKSKAAEEIDELIKSLDKSMTYAVRSSALNEDGESASFAGQYETVTDVSVDEIKDAINEVLSSANNSRVVEYTNSFQENNLGIAVVIQIFVKPKLAGVTFTSDVITGSDAFMIGNYVHGEGEQLVSGAENAESFRINKLKFSYEGSPEMKSYGKKMYKYCNEILKYYGMPMDIEWAISSKKLYILQARPITTLCRLKKESYRVNGSLSGNKLLTRTNVGEIFMKPVSPMTFSVLEKINEFLGLPDWLDNIYGQPYMNITVMCSLLVSLGMSEKKAYEKIKDLAGNIPEGISIPIAPFDRKLFFSNLKKLIFPKKKCKLNKKEKQELVENIPNLCDELIAEIKMLPSNAELANYWDNRLVPLLNDGLASVLTVSGTKMGPLFTTRGKISKIAGSDMANRLCGGCVGIIDCMKPLLLLEDVVEGKISKVEYVKLCGHRCVNEMELMEPRPYENPSFPDNVIADYVKSNVSVRKMQEEQEMEYGIALKEFKESFPSKSKWIDKKIDKFKDANKYREDIRSKGVLMFCVFREFILRIGEVNSLGNDVFMLMIDELFELIRNNIDAKKLIANRKISYEKYLEYPTFPSVVMGRFNPDEWLADTNSRKDFYSASYVYDSKESNKESTNELNVIKGFPGAAGIIEGTVRVITDVNDIDSIEKGDILVTIATNIGWTLCFPKVSAIVTDIGAPLSHAAIVAREFGIPAVVGCGNATTNLKTGDRVKVDGARGIVYLVGVKNSN